MKAFYIKGTVTKDLTRSFEDIIKESETGDPYTKRMGRLFILLKTGRVAED